MAMSGNTAIRRTRRLKQAAPALAIAWLVGGCSAVERFYDTKLTPDTPIGWWHDLQGGVIADQRPPPPGVDDPYPNLSTVPPRPVMTDPVSRRALAGRLASERDRTQREVAQDPLVPVAPPRPAAPVAAGRAAPAASPPPDPDGSVVVLDGATAPPAPRIPPPVAVAATPTPKASAARGTAPAPDAAPVVSGPLPELPGGAPAFPTLPGIPASAFAPATPRLPPSLAIPFARGSASVPAAAEAALRQLADRRAGATILVSAGGEAPSTLPDAQAAALPLAWRRVQALGRVLTAAGVPMAALREDAVATGRGGSARLLQ